jgi:hypothetical protein
LLQLAVGCVQKGRDSLSGAVRALESRSFASGFELIELKGTSDGNLEAASKKQAGA